MDITVVGLGYVGTVAAVCLADAGHDVQGVDISRDRVNSLALGEIPFHEPGLLDLLRNQLKTGGLGFICTTDPIDFWGHTAMICVDTPPSSHGGVNLNYVRSAISWVRSKAPKDTTVVMKSTIPPGSGKTLQENLSDRMMYVANPEFLREGQAINDWKHPDRIVFGSEDMDSANLIMKEIYQLIWENCPHISTDITSAEMIKYASNAFLATRVSFINEIASLCESVGASIDVVSNGLAMDARTGSKIYAGIGYGGSCFPKDVQALDHLGSTHGINMELLRSVITVNKRQRMLPMTVLRNEFAGFAVSPKVAILGLSFKPRTDDIRESPGIDIAHACISEGWDVSVYDPVAINAARNQLPNTIKCVGSIEEATDGARAVVLATEWDEIVQADWETIITKMLQPYYLFDGRNALNSEKLTGLGFQYRGVG